MAIIKDNQFKNKYILQQDSTDEEFQEILKGYTFKCIICNRETAKHFGRKISFLGGCLPITINNNMLDGVFWINGIY